MNKTASLLIILLLCIVFRAKAEDNLPPLITVTGKGKVRLPPDQVIVTVAVELRHESLDQVLKENDSKTAAIIAYLKKQGIGSKDIQTSYISVEPYYSYEENGPIKT